MILVCPACHTRFHIEVGALGTHGRKVRCAKCRQVWHAEPPEDAPRELAETPAGYAPPPPAARRAGAGVLAWFGASLCVAALAYAVVYRDDVVRAWPQSAPLFRTANLTLAIDEAVKVEDVAASRMFESGVSVLVVEGAIVNRSNAAAPAPAVRVVLIGEQGRELATELVTIGAVEISAGDRVPFTARMINPPREASTYRISLEAAPT
ncbi:DUF3426 domain-containing protein [Marinivivus vitaminiproducens]|uniref:DUF3426 domain-containing protein n=1 Tax=Marinivivus vitaminiproducens TaxID=3035935 RepID=UPI0027A1C1DA|nr:DUF3426 domain-containing protein [Geminicoccaceae bacterium SCSIO 64248]